MGLINNTRIKLNKWCFNCWVSIGNKIGWIKTINSHSNRGRSIIICNLLVKESLLRKLPGFPNNTPFEKMKRPAGRTLNKSLLKKPPVKPPARPPIRPPIRPPVKDTAGNDNKKQNKKEDKDNGQKSKT